MQSILVKIKGNLVLIHVAEMLLDKLQLSQPWTVLLLPQVRLRNLDLKPHSLEIVNVPVRGVPQKQLDQSVSLLNLVVLETVLDALVVEVTVREVELAGEVRPMFGRHEVSQMLVDLRLNKVELDQGRGVLDGLERRFH